MKSIYRRIPVTLLAVLLTSFVSISTRAATLVCTNTGNWADPAIWNPNQSPGGADTVSIASSFTVTITNASTVAGLTLSSGTLTGSGDVTVTGAMTWSGGAMTGSGRTIIANTGTLVMNNTAHSLYRVLQNDGAAIWTAGDIRMSSGTFTNNGSFTANSAALLQCYGDGGVNAFNNTGTFAKQGVGNTSFSVATVGVAFNNSGTVDVQDGTLTLNAGGSNTTTLFMGAAGALVLNASYTHSLGSSLNGTGTVTVSGGTHTFPAGTFTPTGIVNFSGGTITINNTFTPASLGTIAATVTFNNVVNYSGSVNLSGTASFGDVQSFSGLTLTGTLSGAGEVTVTGTLTWTSGTMSGSGRTIIANTGTLVMNNTDHSLQRVLQNDGVATWTAGAFRMSSGTFTNNGSFTANSGATLSCWGDGGVSAFNNAGTFTKLAACRT